MSLQIWSFGRFQITYNHNQVPALSLRSSKMWDVLKYLITYRGKKVSTEKLTEALWPDVDIPDPAKNIRDIIYRLRKTLSAYGGEQNYIVFAQNGYLWNPDIDCHIDSADFETNLNNARDIERAVDERVSLYNQAIDLYKGEYLGDSLQMIWVTSFINYYRRLYLQAVEELAELYEGHYDLEDIILLYNKAVVAEPLEESLYVSQIRALIKNGEYALAKRQYKHVEAMLLREFNTKPSRILQNLLNEINNAFTRHIDDINTIKKNLDQVRSQKNAFFCSPETFKQLYFFDKRSEDRIQFPIFLGMVAIMYSQSYENEEDLKSAMKQLRQIMLRTLRKDDVICQYSANQFLLMLSAVDGHGSEAALKRVKQIFERDYAREDCKLEIQITNAGKALGS